MPTQLPEDIVAQDEFARHRHEFYLLPSRWQQFAAPHRLAWTIVQFATNSRNNIPTTPGLYTFVLQPQIAQHPACSYLMYAGKATDLRQRFTQYLTTEQRPSGRPKLRRFFYLYEGYVYFAFTEVSEQELGLIEDKLIGAYVPPLNIQLPADVRRPRGAF